VQESLEIAQRFLGHVVLKFVDLLSEFVLNALEASHVLAAFPVRLDPPWLSGHEGGRVLKGIFLSRTIVVVVGVFLT